MARPSTAPSKQLSRRTLVSIKRDQNTVSPRVVWEHEIPILQAIHGEDEVQVLDPSTLDEGYSAKTSSALLPYNKQQDNPVKPSESQCIGFVFIGDPEAEYNRLIDAYGNSTEDAKTPMARFVYGRFQERRFAPLLGKPELSDLPPAQLVEIILSTGYIDHVAHDAPREERMAVAEREKQLRALPADQLLKIATERALEPA
jgi:hypothetical protein